MQEINFEGFMKVGMFSGTVLTVEENVKARKPAYILTIDFGEHGIKKTSAQVTENYTLEELIGTQVVAVLNFPAKRIAGFKSEVLVLGCLCQENDVVLLRPSKPVENGSRVA